MSLTNIIWDQASKWRSVVRALDFAAVSEAQFVRRHSGKFLFRADYIWLWETTQSKLKNLARSFLAKIKLLLNLGLKVVGLLSFGKLTQNSQISKFLQLPVNCKIILPIKYSLKHVIFCERNSWKLAIIIANLDNHNFTIDWHRDICSHIPLTINLLTSLKTLCVKELHILYFACNVSPKPTQFATNNHINCL